MTREGTADAVVERVSLILGCFTAGDAGLPVTELARRTRLPRSTVHRLCRQLSAAGLLQVERGRVHLGLRLFELGQLIPEQRTLRALAVPFLHDLRDTTRHTTSLAVMEGRDIVFLDRVPGPQSAPLPFRQGARYTAHATALGKAIMAHLPQDQVTEYLSQGLEPLTGHTIVEGTELLAALEEVRLLGLSYDRQETRLGVHCVASPIFDRRARVLGAISATGLQGAAGLARSGQAVHNAALNLTRALRHRQMPSARTE